jgi:DNA-directed RNA polymerase sigma subunit (sigma70/sigma32)
MGVKRSWSEDATAEAMTAALDRLIAIRARGCERAPTETLTLEEIGERLGRSKERIRQIEEAALGKMRRAAGEKWRDFIEDSGDGSPTVALGLAARPTQSRR